MLYCFVIDDVGAAAGARIEIELDVSFRSCGSSGGGIARLTGGSDPARATFKEVAVSYPSSHHHTPPPSLPFPLTSSSSSTFALASHPTPNPPSAPTPTCPSLPKMSWGSCDVRWIAPRAGPPGWVERRASAGELEREAGPESEGTGERGGYIRVEEKAECLLRKEEGN